MSGPAPIVYVSNGRGGTVTAIDTATNTPGPPISVGLGPGLIAITPDGKTVYVTSNELWWCRSRRLPAGPARRSGSG